MKQSYIFVGLGVLVILIGLLFVNPDFTRIMQNKVMSDKPFTLSSSAFTENSSIPSKYTCDEIQMPPPLTFSGTPDGTKSLTLIMEDPDVPKQLRPSGVFVHWVIYNIPADKTSIREGERTGTPGKNGAGNNEYAGPCPPAEYEPSEHRYFFTLYALDSELALSAGATKEEVLSAMQGHILAQTQLMGKYKKR
jgi:Raf kinase inhibitor-like YbhB/YbcL family protein